MTSMAETQLSSCAGDNILVAIPLCLFRNILQNWLTTKSIAALDRACCERQLRNSLCSALEGSNLVLSVDSWLNASKSGMLVRWISKRQIRLSSVAFAGPLSPRACAMFANAVSQTVDSIKLYNNPGLLSLVGALCRVLRRVELHSFQDRQALSMFLFSAQNSIEQLSFDTCQSKSALHLQGVHLAKVKELTFRSSFGPNQTSALVDRCPNLSCLKIHAGSMTCRNGTTMAFPSNLKYLVLENVSIADSQLREAFQVMPCLEGFSYGTYESNYQLATETFEVLLRNSHLLSSIKLGQYASSDANLVAIVQCCSGLRRLSVRGFYELRPETIESILRECAQLVELAMYGAPLARQDDKYAAMLRHGGRALQVLDLCGSQIGPELIVAVAQLPNLRELGLCRSTNASRTHGFDFIAKHAPQLRTVRALHDSSSTNGNGSSSGNSPFTPLACSLWEAMYPRVCIVTDREHSLFWQALAFPIAPATNLTYEPNQYSDSE